MNINGKRVLNIRLFPLLFVFQATGIIVAIYLRYAVAFSLTVAFFIGSVIAAVLLRKKKEVFFYVVFCSIAFLLGSWQTFICQMNIANRAYSEECDLRAIVIKTDLSLSYTEEYDGDITLTLNNVTFNGKKLNGLALYKRSDTTGYEEIRVSDDREIILLGASIDRIDPIEDNSLFCRGYRYRITGGEISVGDVYKPNLARSFKSAVLNTLTVNCGVRNGGLIYALIFGDKDYFASDFYADFVSLGIAHIFAVSGLHIAVIYAALLMFLKLIRMPKIPSIIISLSAVLAFLYLCNFSVSVVRSAIFIFAHVICRLTGRRYDSLSVWALSAIIGLIILPYNLISYSFLLSYGSVLSVILLYKPFERVYTKLKVKDKVNSVLSMQTAVTVGGLPISAMLFSELSFVAFPVNVLFLPLFSLFYPFLLLLVLFCTLFPSCGILLYPFSFILTWIDQALSGVGASGLTFSTTLNVVFYLALALLCFVTSDYVLLSKKVKKVLLSIVTILVGVYYAYGIISTL